MDRTPPDPFVRSPPPPEGASDANRIGEVDAHRANELESRRGLQHQGPPALADDPDKRADAANPGQQGPGTGANAGAGSTGASPDAAREAPQKPGERP